MKLFLTKIAIFMLGLLGYFGINNAINSMLIPQEDLQLNSATLIMGDSHTQYALNPDLFRSARNISQKAEPYFLTYWKLKAIIDRHDIDTVILGFAHQNIAAFNDKKLSDKFWSSQMFNRIYSLGELRTLHDIEIDNFEYSKTYLRNMLLYPKRQHIQWLGEYHNTRGGNVSNYQKVIRRHYFYNGSNIGVSKVAIRYLDSIIALCKEHQIKLVLVGSPVHQDYYTRIPSNIMIRYDLEKKRLIRQGVLVLDFIDSDYEDKHFLNADHLNETGATKFTLAIIERLSKFQDSFPE